MEDPQQVTLMELCNQGIGVYSPHTSIDGAVGGMNDWLAEVATGGLDAVIEPIIPVSVEGIFVGWRSLQKDTRVEGTDGCVRC